MPARTSPSRLRGNDRTGFGGFAGFTPSGIDLPPTGDYDAPTVPTPSLTVFPGGGRPSGTHTVPAGPRPTFNSATNLTPDPSGAGLTPSGLTGETLRSLPNARWAPDVRGSLFAETRGARGEAEVVPTIASSGGRPPTFVTDPNEDWLGDPTQTVRNDGLPTAPGIAADEPTLFADNEWTTSPGDRRFLPSPQGPGASQYVGQPQNVAGFGGNMTIGQFLNTPLAFLRFGEGRGNVGAGTVTYADQSHTTPAQLVETDPVTGWSPSPTEAANADTAFAAAEQRGAEETGGSVAASGARPGSRFGNLNSPPGRGLYRDAAGNWRPISGASQDVRWDPSAPTGNFTASQTTEAFVAAGGYSGNPNQMDAAPLEGRMSLDAEGNLQSWGPMYGPGDLSRKPYRDSQGGPAPYGTVAAQLALNNWRRQQPDYIAWKKAQGG